MTQEQFESYREACKRRFAEAEQTTEKENVMNMGNTRILVNDKLYAVKSVDWIQTPGEFPRIRVEADINPRDCVGGKYPQGYRPYGCYPSTRYTNTKPSTPPTITNVIFNPPATIVFWSDKTKTVVKCDYDLEPYDPEKGIAMAISKKLYGNNKYEYYNTFKHWLKKWDKNPKFDQCRLPSYCYNDNDPVTISKIGDTSELNLGGFTYTVSDDGNTIIFKKETPNA